MPIWNAFRALLCSIAALLSISIASGQQTNTPAAGQYRIAGTVVSRSDGHPLARARVTINNTKNNQEVFSTLTSEDGKFAFTGLHAGKYALQGGRRGYLSSFYEQHEQFSTAIVTGAGVDSENLVLRLWPAGYITGKVLDESGDPVRNANVSLYSIHHEEGVSRIVQVKGANTDDLGSFELGPEGPGTYFVAAQTVPWYAMHALTRNQAGSSAEQLDPALDVAYPLTYYSDVTDPSAATTVALRGGDRVQLEIHMSPVPALHILFHAPEGVSNGAWFPQFLHTGLGQNSIVPGESVQQVSPGLFEVSGVPAGRYSIRISNGKNQSEIKQVDVLNDGEELDTSGGAGFSTLNLSLHVAGESSFPANLSVGLRRPHGGIERFQPIGSKSETKLKEIPPGEYELVVFAPDKQYFVAQITSTDAQIPGRLLTITPGANVSVAASLITNTESVYGYIKNGDKAFAGAMVVLVPKDPINNPDLFRRDQSDLDGSFQLRSVVPGFYTIVAIQDGWDLDWSQPATMVSYLKNAEAIEVGNQRSLNLAASVQVQPR
jgi:hypothetical protein